jgi:hypothetical protein
MPYAPGPVQAGWAVASAWGRAWDPMGRGMKIAKLA